MWKVTVGRGAKRLEVMVHLGKSQVSEAGTQGISNRMQEMGEAGKQQEIRESKRLSSSFKEFCIILRSYNLLYWMQSKSNGDSEAAKKDKNSSLVNQLDEQAKQSAFVLSPQRRNQHMTMEQRLIYLMCGKIQFKKRSSQNDLANYKILKINVEPPGGPLGRTTINYVMIRGRILKSNVNYLLFFKLVLLLDSHPTRKLAMMQ